MCFFFFVNNGRLPRLKQSSEHFSQINIVIVFFFFKLYTYLYVIIHVYSIII